MLEQFRTYEISVWSLQDDFLIVLKRSNFSYKGQAQNEPELILNVDGTQELNFSIPMYLTVNGKRIENPLWRNYTNGTITANLRKIKVILNKNTENESVYEFIITKVTERHEEAQLYCDVECEGLAFQELGKTGFKIFLTPDDFYNDDLDWFCGDQSTPQPKATLQYWLNKFLTPYPENGIIDSHVWYYQIQMDWSAYTQYNGSSLQLRDSNKVYEEEYVSSWQMQQDKLIAANTEYYKEKERLVDFKESNKYNLTQDLAEAFGIYCKYVYDHDDQYHITCRRVVFYNNFLVEDFLIDINYKYNTTSITRELDSTELVTKMYVKPVENTTANANGIITIMDVGANKSKEDYLLNFDYLHEIHAIDDDVYAYINEYETKMYTWNTNLIPIQEKIIDIQNQLPEVQAKLTILTNAIQLDKERLSNANNLLNKITNNTGILEVSAANPSSCVLLPDSTNDGQYYLNITVQGIIPNTIHIYRTCNYGAVQPEQRLTNEITTGVCVYDEFNNLTRINNLQKSSNQSSIVYLTYQYSPVLYYERIKQVWEYRLMSDEKELDDMQNTLDDLNATLTAYLDQQAQILNAKKQEQSYFETLMGPALREGYWQPDDYHDYGDKHIDTLEIPSLYNESSVGVSGYTTFIWDAEKFDEELKLYYELGVNQTHVYYPCIDLSNILSDISDHLDTLSVLFYDYPASAGASYEARKRRALSLGSQCELAFIKQDNSNAIKPVLLVTGVESFTDTELGYLTDSSTGQATLGHLQTTYNSETGTITTIEEDYIEGNALSWITLTDDDVIVYPRIVINSLALKNSSDQLSLIYENTILKNYEDFYVLTRATDTNYYITLKPMVLVRENELAGNVQINFTLSNADTAIYLDAKEVLKNSAYPQVSYELKIGLVQKNYIKTLDQILNRIVHINDNDLKFENVQGYVSKVVLKLDQPWEDSVEIKNYKTKFEDLFEKIVASTEQMKKNEYIANIINENFDDRGEFKTSAMQSVVNNVDLNYAFNNGKLTIDEENGILGASDSGVVAFRGGGIFTATNKDETGNWIWNTGIVPQGINAELITTGQLDTNKIQIFAGDKVAFQLNADGLYAYKSFFSDQELLDAASQNQTVATALQNNSTSDLDVAQYVVHNADGLFLVAKQGALVLNEEKNGFINLTQDVKRVEVSWDGFKLRNWANNEVFYADPDTGNLNITGNITATSLLIYAGQNTITDEPIYESLNNYIKVIGQDNSYFQVSSDTMGFFASDNTPMLYYYDGNLVLENGAHIGGANGWTIGTGSLYSGNYSSLDLIKAADALIDASGGIYIGVAENNADISDGFGVYGKEVYFKTSEFAINVVTDVTEAVNDTNTQFKIDKEGAYINNLQVGSLTVNDKLLGNILGRYSGPTDFVIDPMASEETDTIKYTLAACIEQLNYQYISDQITITIKGTIYEEVTLVGIYGSGKINILCDLYSIPNSNNNQYGTLYGHVICKNCSCDIRFGSETKHFNCIGTNTLQSSLIFEACSHIEIYNAIIFSATSSKPTISCEFSNLIIIKLQYMVGVGIEGKFSHIYYQTLTVSKTSQYTAITDTFSINQCVVIGNNDAVSCVTGTNLQYNEFTPVPSGTVQQETTDVDNSINLVDFDQTQIITTLNLIPYVASTWRGHTNSSGQWSQDGKIYQGQTKTQESIAIDENMSYVTTSVVQNIGTIWFNVNNGMMNNIKNISLSLTRPSSVINQSKPVAIILRLTSASSSVVSAQEPTNDPRMMIPGSGLPSAINIGTINSGETKIFSGNDINDFFSSVLNNIPTTSNNNNITYGIMFDTSNNATISGGYSNNYAELTNIVLTVTY